MPHDKTGRKIDLGDVVKVVTHNHKLRIGYATQEIIGTVIELHERDTCNGKVAWVDIDNNKKEDYFDIYNSKLVWKRDGGFVCN